LLYVNLFLIRGGFVPEIFEKRREPLKEALHIILS